MTTSGTTTYNPLRDVILKRSLRMVGAFASTDSPRPEQLADALDVLNLMLKEWQRMGLLWLREWATLFLNQGQARYLLAPATVSGFAHACTSTTQGASAYAQTNLAAAAVLGAASVSVDSATGISNGYYVGIENDSGILEWFYASVSGTTISLFTDSGLTTPGALSAAAAADNVVYAYATTVQAGRPTRVFSAVRKLYDSTAAEGQEIPIFPLGRTDYEAMSDKTTQAKVVNYFYDPQLGAGVLYVWPTPDTPQDKLVLTVDRMIQDVVADTETLDLPQEALNAITYGLAVELEPEYPMDMVGFQKLKSTAQEKIAGLLAYNRELAPLQFQMDMR